MSRQQALLHSGHTNIALWLVAFVVIALGAYGWDDLKRHVEGDLNDAKIHTENQRIIRDAKITKVCMAMEPVARDICIRDHLESEYETQRSEKDLQAQRNMARTTFSMLVLVWLQTVIGLGGLYFVIRSVDAAALSAVAAGEQIETQILAERPRLRVVNISPVIRTHRRKGGRTEAVITCDVINFGKTPAYISEYSFRYRVFEKMPQSPDYDFTRSDNNFVVFPDKPASRGPYQLMSQGKPLSTPLTQGINEEWEYVDKVVLFYGYLIFEDAFRKIRKIGFGYSISPLSEIRLAGGSAYNYEQQIN